MVRELTLKARTSRQHASPLQSNDWNHPWNGSDASAQTLGREHHQIVPSLQWRLELAMNDRCYPLRRTQS